MRAERIVTIPPLQKVEHSNFLTKEKHVRYHQHANFSLSQVLEAEAVADVRLAEGRYDLHQESLLPDPDL